jgi:hypothetical protein
MGREAIEGDGNFTVILYQVDRELTEYDSVVKRLRMVLGIHHQLSLRLYQ